MVTVLGAVLLILGIAFILRHRRGVLAGCASIRTASSRFGAAQSLQALAAVWHILAIGYLVGFFIVAAFGIEGGFAYMLRGTILSLAIIAAAWLVVFCAGWLLDRLLPPAVTGEIEPSSMQARISAYRPVIAQPCV